MRWGLVNLASSSCGVSIRCTIPSVFRLVIPSRFLSANPRMTATAMTHRAAIIIPGMIARNNSPSSTCSAVIIRAVGPPQGNKFMIEFARTINTAKSIIFIFNLRYTGSRAEQTTRVVVDPSPSTEIPRARIAVPTKTFKGSPLTARTIKLTNG